MKSSQWGQLWDDGSEWPFDLVEVRGRRRTIPTTGTVRRSGTELLLVVCAEDPDPLELVATAPAGARDGQLYEEDCVQVATALPGENAIHDFLLVNPLGRKRGSVAAESWPVDIKRDASGWTIRMRLPITDAMEALGLSVHRFFRGIRGEVQGLGRVLPHPLDPGAFRVMLLKPTRGPAGAARRVSTSIRRAHEEAPARAIAAARAQLAAVRDAGKRDWVALAAEIAAEQAKAAVAPYRYWKENHLQLGLLDLWAVTGDARWIELGMERARQTWDCRCDAIHARDSLWGIVPPTWIEAGVQSYSSVLTTGVVLQPVTRLMRTVMETPSLRGFRPEAESWMPLCRESIAFHDREWIELPDGSGVYIEPYQKGPRRIYPSGGSRLNPFNRVHFFAMPMLDVAAMTGDAGLRDRIVRIARHFKSQCERLPNGSLVWEYEPSAYPSEGEDLSHAAAQVQFVEDCVRDGIVFSARELRGMARTLAMCVFRHGDVPCGTIRGYHPGLHIAVGAWSGLTRYAPAVLPRIEAVLAAAMQANTFDFRHQGWGVRLIASVGRARQELKRVTSDQGAHH